MLFIPPFTGRVARPKVEPGGVIASPLPGSFGATLPVKGEEQGGSGTGAS